MKKKLVVVGSGQYNYDVIKVREYPKGFVPGEKNAFVDKVHTEEVGGTCGNVMCMMQHLGWDARPQVKLTLGADGQNMVASLKHFGCDARYVMLAEGGGFSGWESIHRRNKKTGEPEMGHRSYGPRGSRFHKITELRVSDEVPALLAQMEGETPDVYFFDHSDAGPRAIAAALKERGSLVYYECEKAKDRSKFLKCVEVADIVKFSDENVPDVSFCAEFPAKLFIQTQGGKGMMFRLPKSDEWVRVEAVPVETIVDWEGCGDTTTAVFLNELGKIGLPRVSELTAEQVKAALSVAAEKAAQCTQYYGSKGWVHAENKALAGGHKKMDKNNCTYPEKWDDEDKRVKVFLAGPIIGGGNWQQKLIARFAGDDRVLFINPYGSNPSHNFEEKASWEIKGLSESEVVVFWLPLQKGKPHEGHEYARTTRFEMGEWMTRREHVVLGIEAGFPGEDYIRFRAKAYNIDVNESFDALVEGIKAKVAALSPD